VDGCHKAPSDELKIIEEEWDQQSYITINALWDFSRNGYYWNNYYYGFLQPWVCINNDIYSKDPLLNAEGDMKELFFMGLNMIERDLIRTEKKSYINHHFIF
jgi:hypothetical protein